MGVFFSEIDRLDCPPPERAASLAEGIVQSFGNRERRGKFLPYGLEEPQTVFEFAIQRDVVVDVVSE